METVCPTIVDITSFTQAPNVDLELDLFNPPGLKCNVKVIVQAHIMFWWQ